MLVGASGGDPIKYAKTLDKVGKDIGIDFIGGYSALVQKGFSAGDFELIKSIPEALAQTDIVCSSVNVGSTKAGINMDAVKLMGQVVYDAAYLTKDKNCIGAGKLVVFVMRLRIILLWREHSMVLARLIVLLMLVYLDLVL